jgi:Peptidase family M1 domain
LAKKSQTALERYKTRRGFSPDDEVENGGQAAGSEQTDSKNQAALPMLLLLLLMVLGFFGWRAYTTLPGAPLQLTYEVDLSEAPYGVVVVTLIAEGKLPPKLSLEFPPGVFGNTPRDLTLLRPSAHSLKDNGSMGQPLTVDHSPSGWQLGTRGLQRMGFIYRVDLSKTPARETDIRKHISTPVSGGVRFAGFEVFLEPTNADVKDITVTIRNPKNLPLLVPWPALIRNNKNESDEPVGPLSDAHLGFGQGYQPGAAIDTPESGTTKTNTAANQRKAAPVPSNLFFHPHDLADLNNALLVCGDIRTLNSQAKDCVIQFTTDKTWNFRDKDAMDLVRRIARTEIGFFGSAPTDQITLLLSTNEVKAADGFDVYGVHTGSSVLVMLPAETTWGMLQEQAASVIAHEMFHGWLGEAITQLDPNTLWFTEGATTWYSARMLTAAGVWTPQHARQVLADRLNKDYVGNPWRSKVTIAEAAADVMGDPEKVRYSYASGIAACMALDQWLSRQGTLNRPLDEVLRYLYDNRDENGLSRQSLEEAVLAVTGINCHLWLENFVYGMDPLPPVDRLI